MATTAIIINSTDGLGKSMQKSMTCVNPDATNEQLAHLGQMITAAQNHTYGNTVRIDKTDCDLESGKAIPTLSASKTQYAASEFTSQAGYYRANDAAILTYNGDGNLFFDKSGLDVNISFELGQEGNGNWYFRPRYAGNTTPTFPTSFTVGFTATENYKAASVEITITA